MQNTGIFQYNSKAVLPMAKVSWDYYCFGSVKPGRNYTSNNGYRFGFQSQEMDDEIINHGGSVMYEFRIYDTRIGRFFSVDPILREYPFYSPYIFSGNRVIDCREMEGCEPYKLFTSPDEAAKDFGRLFNDNSIRNNVEGVAIIFSYTFEISCSSGSMTLTLYSYTFCRWGTERASVPVFGDVPELGKTEAFVHAHAASTQNMKQGGADDNKFSGTEGLNGDDDIGICEKKSINGYVATPNGSMLKYDVVTNKVTKISSEMPKDTGPGTGMPGAGVSPKSTSTYTFKEGDTLNSIAGRYGVSLDSITKENKITDVNSVKPGTELSITN